MMVANPVWMPGSLDNDELEKQITFWRIVSNILGKLGFTGIAYVGAKSKSVLKDVGKSILAADPKNPSGFKAVTGPIRSALKPDALSGMLIFGTAAKTIADSSVTDLETEASRRG